MVLMIFAKVSLSAGRSEMLVTTSFLRIWHLIVREFSIANLIHLDNWKVNHKLKKPKQVVPPIKWKHPPSGWIKLIFDGSIKNGVATTSFLFDDNAHTLSLELKILESIPLLWLNALLWEMV
ncbi:unnamed protein product [Prunus brigantina]